MKFKILIVVGKFYDDAATHLIKGSTSLLDQYKKFETTHDWAPPSILPHFPNESEDTSRRKHAIEYKIYEEIHNKMYKYTIGEFLNFKDAKNELINIKNTNKVTDAFLTAYENGHRISINQAIKLTK